MTHAGWNPSFMASSVCDLGELISPGCSFFLSFFPFLLFRAAPVAYGGSQVRERIGAAAAGLHHSSQQRRILDPLNEARDRTCVLMDAHQICQ